MKVITTHPIRTYTTPAELTAEMEEFANIDGNNDVQVKHFQIYANKKGAKLKVNGKWDSKTRTAYAKYGQAWEKAFSAAYPNYSITSPEGKKRSGAFWDKLKGVWVAAVDSGLVDQGLAAISSTGYQAPAVQEFNDQSGVSSDDFAPKDAIAAKHKWYSTLLVIVGVAVGGYVAYKLITKKS